MARRMKTTLIALLGIMSVPALAANIKSAQGESYWDGDPGPITDSYWTSGQYKYDPNGYMERYVRQGDLNRLMTVYAAHSGGGRCVFRRRVQVSDWDWRHPILRVCDPKYGVLKDGE